MTKLSDGLEYLVDSLHDSADVINESVDFEQFDPNESVQSQNLLSDGSNPDCPVGELLPYYLSGFLRLEAQLERIDALAGDNLREFAQSKVILEKRAVGKLRELGKRLIVQLSKESGDNRTMPHFRKWIEDHMTLTSFEMTNPLNGRTDAAHSLYHSICMRDTAIGFNNYLQGKVHSQNNWHIDDDRNADWIEEEIEGTDLEGRLFLFDLLDNYLQQTLWPYRDLVGEGSELSVVLEQPYINQLKTRFDMTMNHEMRESIIREAEERGFLDSNNPDTRQLLDRLNDLISGIGYDNLRQDLADHGHVYNRYPNVTVIPSDASTSAPHCTSTLIALAHRANGPHGFAGVVDQMVEHLRRCRKTRQVIFITDHWGFDKITKVHPTLNQFMYPHGMKFLFLLVDPFNKHRWNIATGLK
jgi:hypothetical protein